jgi:hypothetical protein
MPFESITNRAGTGQGQLALAVAYNEVTQIISMESAPTACSMPDKRALLL